MSAHPPILRMLRIHQLIQGRRYPNVPDLARSLGVSQRTVQRDVETMRDRMGAPLAFNPIENGTGQVERGKFTVSQTVQRFVDSQLMELDCRSVGHVLPR